MEELISRIVRTVGVDESTARNAVGIILTFLYQTGDRDKVVSLAAGIPGAEAFIDIDGGNEAATLGGLGGLMGGGVMEAVGKLQAIGLGMSEVQGVAQETIGFFRERVGSDILNDIVASVPGLSQFV